MALDPVAPGWPMLSGFESVGPVLAGSDFSQVLSLFARLPRVALAPSAKGGADFGWLLFPSSSRPIGRIDPIFVTA